MQYLLSEKEITALSPKSKMERYKDQALRASMLIATTTPWIGHNNRETGCVADGSTLFCKGCPAEEFCTYDHKVWPKE